MSVTENTRPESTRPAGDSSAPLTQSPPAKGHDQTESRGFGRLIFQISTAYGAIPLEGAQVILRSVKSSDRLSEPRSGTPADTPNSIPDGPVDPASVPAPDGRVLAILYSDFVGKTEPIALPAPPRSESLRPSVENTNSAPSQRPFAVYDAEIRLENYYPQAYIHIPVFDGITSIQSVSLIPLPENGERDGLRPDGNRFYESENPLL